jgi:hypothetical protein
MLGGGRVIRGAPHSRPVPRGFRRVRLDRVPASGVSAPRAGVSRAPAAHWLGTVNGSGCFELMNSASNYRDRANHLRQLAEMTWQDDLEASLRRAAQDYDEVADDLEAGCTEIRHNELIRE